MYLVFAKTVEGELTEGPTYCTILGEGGDGGTLV